MWLLSNFLPVFRQAPADYQIGSGAPTHQAPKGTLYVNTAAVTTTTRLYVNTDSGTTWASFTASA